MTRFGALALQRVGAGWPGGSGALARAYTRGEAVAIARDAGLIARKA